MRNSKDAALGFAIRSLLNSRFHALGEITDVSLDTSQRRVKLRVALRGESKPIDLDVREYDLQRTNTGSWLTIVDATASREWLTAALQQFAVGQRIHLSPKAGVALRLLT